ADRRSPLRISRPAHHTERHSVQPVARSGDLATTTFPFARTDLAADRRTSRLFDFPDAGVNGLRPTRPVIQEPAGDDPLTGPAQANGSVAPGPPERDALPFEGGERVGSEGRGALADDDAPRPGPSVERFRVGRLAAVMGGEHDLGRRIGAWPRGQLDES